MDLYSIGEMLIDFTPGGAPGTYVRNPGGAPANVAIAAAKNGLTAGMCCKVGDDDFGRFLLETLEQYHVKALSPALCSQAVTTMAFVTIAPDGDRSFTFARKPGADMFIQESDVKEEDIAQSVIVHAGSFSLASPPASDATAKALRLGREKNKLVSFDVNYRGVLWEDEEQCAVEVRKILPYVDLLKISQEEADMVGGEKGLPALMERYGITAVVETLGGGGARCWHEGKVLESAGKKCTCVDATGAGDAFWGGFLSYLRLQGVETASQITDSILQKALAYGNAAGGLCVQGKGAIPSLPTREQIEAAL
jgi:sugar/nucleoside kinase (ribokinase family)